MSITLHPTLGINPRLTFCPRCGGEARELALAGARNTKRQCTNCGTWNYGALSSESCGGCGEKLYGSERVELDEREKVPGSPCEACEKEMAEYQRIVSEGGVYFKCKDCKASGVIKPNEFTAAIRKHAGVEAPRPIGVEFTKADCPRCGPNKVDVDAKTTG